MKKIVFLFALPVICFPVHSQIKVTSTNNVGIQSDNPVSKLSVGNNGSTYAKAYIYNSNTGYLQRGLEVEQVPAGTFTFGIVGRVSYASSGSKVAGLYGNGSKDVPYSSGRTFGVMGIAGNATDGYNQAIYGELRGTHNGTAIFAATPGKTECEVNGIYAGYLRGKVYIEDKVGIMTTTLDTSDHSLQVDGTILCKGWLDFSSDERNKTDILSISQGALEKVTGLRGVSYMLKEPERDYKIQESLPDTGMAVEPVIFDNQMLYERRLSGFIAQELQPVFPDLVTTDKAGMMSINYIGLIPYLVEAMKEQQTEIEGLRQDISDQEAEILKIKDEISELRALIQP